MVSLWQIIWDMNSSMLQKFIFFDDNGTLKQTLPDKELSERLEHVERAVIPGFTVPS